jgi:hypothetical protein
MPNWCSNRVTFTSENHDTIDFIRGAFDSDEPFNVLRPEPDWRQTPNEKGWLPGPLYKGNCVTYFPDGTVDDRWYHWRLNHWGVKWDIGNEVSCDEDSDDMVEYEFLTPWGPPDELKLYLEDKYEDLDITWFYDEPGMCFSGYL